MLKFFGKKQNFFTPGEQQKILQAIKDAEKNTSGEVRVFTESKCRFVDPLDRAAEIFFSLKMNNTVQRNAVLVYLAVKDRQLAVFADEGIYLKAGKDFWQKEVNLMIVHFNREDFAKGLATVVDDIGKVLAFHFPYEADTDKNELPDDIVFGK